jgi:hypothetical protein
MNSEFGIRNSEFPPTHPDCEGRVENSKLKTQNSKLGTLP